MIVVDDEGAAMEDPASLLQDLFEKIDEKEPGQKLEIIVDRKVSLVFLSFCEGFVSLCLRSWPRSRLWRDICVHRLMTEMSASNKLLNWP